MATASPERLRIAGKIAATKRFYPDADTTELERDLKAATLEDHITRLVDSAPPLTDKQRERLARLLWGSER